MAGRAQASLPPLVVALLALTGGTLVGLTLASGALAAAERPAEQRATAVALADRLVAPDSPLTDRQNVINRTALERLDGAALETAFPVAAAVDVRVTVDDEVRLQTGGTSGGTTIERLVLIGEQVERSTTPAMGPAGGVTLPRRVEEVELTLSPPNGTRIETVRANDRVALHDPDGLAGSFEVALTRRESTRLTVEANGSLRDGDVEIAFAAERTRKVTLGVTVDG